MTEKCSCEALRRRVRELEQIAYKQKRAEKALLERAQILAHVHDAVVITDMEGRITDFNPGAERLHGYMKAEVLGKPVSILYPPEHQTMFEDIAMKELAEKDEYSLEITMTQKNGEPVYAHLSLSLLRSSAGEPFGTIGYALDLTNRKAVEDALRDSEKKLIDAQRIAKLGYFVWDVQGGELTWSEALFEMLGYDKSEKVDCAKVNAEIYHPDDFERITRWLNDCILSGKEELTPNEYRLICKDGHVVYVRTIGVIQYEKGKPAKVFGTIQNITECKQMELHRQKMEAKLSKRNRLIETILNNLPIGLAVHYIDEGKATYINRKFEEIYGWPKEEINHIEKFFNKVYPEPAYRETIRNQIEKDIQSGDPERMSWEGVEVTGKDAKKRVVSAKNIPIHEQNLMISTVQDITESKALQDRLQQAQKMEAIGSLAGGIAHDFNNILFPIIGLSELLLEDLSSDSREFENVREILRAGKRGSELVKQILSFSRQTEHKMMPIQVQHVLKEAIKLGRSTIPSNIGIDQKIQNDCGMVLSDPIQIHQIAMNLITNAYHAVEATSGRISIELRESTVEKTDGASNSVEPGSYAILTVSDTGCGIDPAVMGKIFEPYFTTKTHGKGTGLGLAVVYGIVKKHGGHVKVFSEPGKGTSFNVYLPLMEKSAETTSIETEKKYESNQERILVVDDEEIIVRLETQILERLGYRVTARLSSVDALEAFKANPDAYDLVITDMAMPNMTGDRLAEELNRVRPGIPVILCTGFSERISSEKAEAMGIRGFLMKPLVKADMEKRIRKVLDEAKCSLNRGRRKASGKSL